MTYWRGLHGSHATIIYLKTVWNNNDLLKGSTWAQKMAIVNSSNWPSHSREVFAPVIPYFHGKRGACDRGRTDPTPITAMPWGPPLWGAHSHHSCLFKKCPNCRKNCFCSSAWWDLSPPLDVVTTLILPTLLPPRTHSRCISVSDITTHWQDILLTMIYGLPVFRRVFI